MLSIYDVKMKVSEKDDLHRKFYTIYLGVAL